MDIASTVAGESQVKAVDQDGTVRTTYVDFTNQFIDASIIDSTMQGGDAAYAKAKVQIKNLDGTPVEFDSLYDFHAYVVDADGHQTYGTPDYEVSWDASGVATEIVVSIPAYDDYGDRLSEGQRKLVVTYVDVAKTKGVFQQRYMLSGSASATTTFVNDATFSAKYGLPVRFQTWGRLEYTSGAGLTKPVRSATRGADVYIANADGLRGQSIMQATVRTDGSVLPYRDSTYDLAGLLPGTYDLIVDGMKFPGALTVADGAIKTDVTVTLYGTATQPGAFVKLYGSVYEAGWANYPLNVEVFLQKKVNGVWSDASSIAQPAKSNYGGIEGQFRFAEFMQAAGTRGEYRAVVKADNEFNEGISRSVTALGRATVSIVRRRAPGRTARSGSVAGCPRSPLARSRSSGLFQGLTLLATGLPAPSM